jgi:hypothetical protein
MIRLPLKPCCPYDQAVLRSAREGHDTTLDLVGVVISNRGQLTHADNMMTSLALAGSLFAEASLIQGAPLPWHIRQKPGRKCSFAVVSRPVSCAGAVHRPRGAYPRQVGGSSQDRQHPPPVVRGRIDPRIANDLNPALPQTRLPARCEVPWWFERDYRAWIAYRTSGAQRRQRLRQGARWG